MPEQPVLLLCGLGAEAEALARLAFACGFALDVVNPAPLEEAANSGEGQSLEGLALTPPSPLAWTSAYPDAQRFLNLPGFANLLANCEISAKHYVCIFANNERERLSALSEALASHAFYIGLNATRGERERLFGLLRASGVPDAELAAVRCPIGLPVGAQGAEQLAVAVMAELLAARAGTLQRMRIED